MKSLPHRGCLNGYLSLSGALGAAALGAKTGEPFTMIDATSHSKLEMLTAQMREEMQDTNLAQYELLVSYLKIFLITASRLKTQHQPAASALSGESREPFILQSLKDLKIQQLKQELAIGLSSLDRGEYSQDSLQDIRQRVLDAFRRISGGDGKLVRYKVVH